MSRILFAILACCLPLAAQAQEPTPATAPAKIVKLSEWPKLSDLDRDKTMGLLGQFRKQEHLHAGAHDSLVALGDAIAPLLFQQVSDRAENVNPDIFAVLDAVLGPQHAALLARESKARKLELRRYIALRLCKLHDPEMLPVLQSMAKDKDEEVAWLANLGLLALAQKEALPAVLARVRADWANCRELIAAVLPAARSREAGQWVLDSMATAKAIEQMNALRVLRYLGTKEHTLALKGYLTAEDNNVKKAAVNALRVIYGEEPLEKLSVFQVIDMAKQWQSK